MSQQQINPGSAPIIWSDIASAFDTINDNFTELYASVGGDAVDFTSLGTNLVPRTTELYDLGSSTKRWRDLWLSGSSIHLGDAVITSTGTTVNLPVGSTIGGLRVDENYFKFISVAGQDNIEADDGTDTLTIAEGNSGITLTTDATTDTLTITNSGVTSLAGTAGQIGVSQSTGGVTLTNLGVISAAAGQGITLNAGTGAVTITNSGVIDLDAGIGIQLSERDPITGVITITNSQPNIPQQVFSIVAVPTQTPLAADSTGDTLNIEVSGAGLSITTAPLTDTLTFTNTGVTSLAVGNGLTTDAGTGSINLTLDATLSRNIIGNVVGDITGSVFADDSTRLIDATEGLIVGDVNNDTVTTYFVNFAGTGCQAFVDEGGYFYLRATPDDSDIIIRTNASGAGEYDFVFGKDGNFTVPTGATITPENKTSGLPVDFTIRGQQTSGTSLSEGGNLYLDGGDGNVEEGYANGSLYLGTESSLTRIGSGPGGGTVELDGYVSLTPGSELDFQGASTLTNLSSITTDLIGSVFADDSTRLIDATEGLIVGPIETTTGLFTGGISGTLTGDVIGSVFADDSTKLVDGVDGTINATVLTGALPALDGSALTGVIAASVDWSDVANTPTTISGYGITDAYVTGVTLDLATQDISNATNITGATGGDISGFTNITGDSGGTISGFTTLTGDTGGDISGFTNITGDSGGTISGFTTLTGDGSGSISGFGDITVTTLFTGTLDTTDSSAITVVPAVVFNSDVTVENELFVDNSVTATNFIGNLTATSVVTSALTTSKVKETVVEKTGATSTVVHDLSTGSVFYHTSIGGNFTANFTNLDIAPGQGTNISLILVQGGTAYLPNAVQIGGSAQTINWQDSTEPTPNNSKKDIVTFSIVNIGETYTVFGALTTFGT